MPEQLLAGSGQIRQELLPPANFSVAFSIAGRRSVCSPMATGSSIQAPAGGAILAASKGGNNDTQAGP